MVTVEETPGTEAGSQLVASPQALLVLPFQVCEMARLLTMINSHTNNRV